MTKPKDEQTIEENGQTEVKEFEQTDEKDPPEEDLL